MSGKLSFGFVVRRDIACDGVEPEGSEVPGGGGGVEVWIEPEYVSGEPDLSLSPPLSRSSPFHPTLVHIRSSFSCPPFRRYETPHTHTRILRGKGRAVLVGVL